MSMSRKDYEADAKTLNDILWMPDSDTVTMCRVIVALADIRAKGNDRFDTERFMEACLKGRDTVSRETPGWDAYQQARTELAANANLPR